MKGPTWNTRNSFGLQFVFNPIQYRCISHWIHFSFFHIQNWYYSIILLIFYLFAAILFSFLRWLETSFDNHWHWQYKVGDYIVYITFKERPVVFHQYTKVIDNPVIQFAVPITRLWLIRFFFHLWSTDVIFIIIINDLITRMVHVFD